MHRKNKAGFLTRAWRRIDGWRGRTVEFDLEPYLEEVEKIHEQAQLMALTDLPDQDLGLHMEGLRTEARQGRRLDELLPRVFALVGEAASRVLGFELFDEQLVAAVGLHRGRLVEMQTGEGKTLAAVLSACLNALTGQGMHILTFNDYLAVRDARWMGPIYEMLGFRVAHIGQDDPRPVRREAYQADITYLTAKEAGYDQLRESIVREPCERILRPCHFALVDEADSILIDEARVPLVIAGLDPEQALGKRSTLAALARALVEQGLCQTDENKRNVYLSDEGLEAAELELRSGDLYGPQNRDLLTRLNQALHAQVLIERDRDYVVRHGRVEVVDEYTGRGVPDRHWPDGLHRALEAKEDLGPSDQGQVLNSITIQHFLKLYPRLSGMTGTARPADREFQEFYGLTTLVLPSHKPCCRKDLPDLLFANGQAKREALLAEVLGAQNAGQPVLIGTSSVGESEQLAELLAESGVSCRVLNARNDEAEAEIVAEAGALGAVTVSTNMAGRGTDICLGGSDGRERERVVALGGLYVIGTNRHESRRIDNQLRGRAGRQGDPGQSRFLVSLDDPLMVKFGIVDLISDKQKRQIAHQRSLQDPALHRKVFLVQRIIEGQNLDIRRTLWEYASYLEEKRGQFQAERSRLLEGGSSGRLASLCPERYESLQGQLSTAVLGQVERQICLHQMDCAWQGYLAHMADVREGIYLKVVGGRDPLSEYQKDAAKAYLELEREVDRRSAEIFSKAQISQDGLDLDREGLRGPSSTWTYLINDNPFEWTLSLAAGRNIGSAAWTGVLAAIFWMIPLWIWFTRRMGRGKSAATPDLKE